MALSRRNMLRLGPSLLAAAATPWQALAESGAEGDQLASLSRPDFAAVVNSTFEASTAKGIRAWMTLAAVDDLKAPPPENEDQFAVRWKGVRRPTPRTEGFTLKFSAFTDPLPQDTYSLNHPTLGSFALLLVPSGPSAYAAIINRLVIGPRT